MRYDRRVHTARATSEFVFHQLVPYLGNKRHLLEVIGAAIASTGLDPERSTFLDAFAGSGVVARFAKRLGFAVTANDWEPYARVLNTAAIQCDAPPPGYAGRIAELDATPGRDGWVTANLCPADDDDADPLRERMFYRRATGRRIDAIRQRIEQWRQAGMIDDAAFCCLLAPLLYQACWLSNTSGVFKGFHHGWGGKNGTALHRILADLSLAPGRFLANGRAHRVLQRDALDLGDVAVDVAYLDPPYNQHPYASNYHVLNSLVLWDQPVLPPPTERGSKAAIRPDWKQRRSAFNHRKDALRAYQTVLDNLDARVVLTSYSTDGTIPVADLIAANACRGQLAMFTREYKRYRTSPTRPSPRPTTIEFVLACDTRLAPEPRAAERALALLA